MTANLGIFAVRRNGVNTDITFGAWLKRRRRQLDLTQKELAEAVGYGLGTLRKIERGTRRPSKDLATYIGKALDIPEEQMPAFVAFARSDPDMEAVPLPAFAQEQIAPPQPAILEPITQVEVATIRHNLPLQLTPFIGRSAEIAALRDFHENPQSCLITILGAGGMGKTRLALETARAHLSLFADGVYFVPLASLSSAEHIIPTIAEQVGAQFHLESSPQTQLLRFLARKRMLLVLDNFEHLLDGAGLVTEILEAAPGVTILATSREKLALSGETIFPLEGMPFPDLDGAEEIEARGAIELFIQSAQRTRADFALRGDDLNQAARICQLVAGMPLALLLAATWVDMLSLEEIADEISGSLDLLQTDLRDMPAHQRSIRATFDRSWQRLSAIEREIFMRLSVFRGGCTRESIQAVSGASLFVIHALVNKSLLWRLPDGRFDIHELLRQYAAEKLEEAGEAGPARNAHSAYFMAFAHGLEAEVKSRQQQAAFSKIEADFENIRRAWNWATKQRNYDGVDRALESVFLYCEREGRFEEGMELFEQAREALAPRSGDEPHLENIF